jgi:hypothetical protein
VAIKHQALGAAETVAAALASGVSCQRFGPVLVVFIHRQRAYAFTRSQTRQPLRLLRLAAGMVQGRRRQHTAGQERRRAQRAADLFHQHTGFNHAQPGATEVLRHQQPAVTHLGKTRPQRAREAVGIVVVAQAAKFGHGRDFREEAACAVAQHDLFFVQHQ